MGIYSISLPDVGEGIAEAELVEWNVAIGDTLLEDEVIGAVMTDKAAVEIPSSVTGKVVWLGGEVGDVIAVGAELLRLEVGGEGNQSDKATVSATPPVQPPTQSPEPAEAQQTSTDQAAAVNANNTSAVTPVVAGSGKVLAAPSVRRKAADHGVDLAAVTGSGPAGRVTRDDLNSYLNSDNSDNRRPDTSITEIKVIGMRRKIAEKMSLAKSRIPHITIVEEVDVSNLEELRSELNTTHQGDKPKLTVLPFVMKAVVEAVREQPHMNAHYDDDREVILQHAGVHIGVATQTPNGLMVPVVKHCEMLSLWESAAQVLSQADNSRSGTATRDDLTGSTITISSLGPLGALATTPIINHPEVAIIGINKIAVRPQWDGQQFMPRKMMNISASFDHRVVDGWDAAVMVQKLKTLLEKPAMLFVGD
ncbi:MAG: dihydrolipoamide acetyltransferase family protein [Pseudomonadota bacterium]